MKAVFLLCALLPLVACRLKITSFVSYPVYDCIEDAHCDKKGQVCLYGKCHTVINRKRVTKKFYDPFCSFDSNCPNGYVCRFGLCSKPFEIMKPTRRVSKARKSYIFCSPFSSCPLNKVCKFGFCVNPIVAMKSSQGVTPRKNVLKMDRPTCAAHADCPKGKVCARKLCFDPMELVVKEPIRRRAPKFSLIEVPRKTINRPLRRRPMSEDPTTLPKCVRDSMCETGRLCYIGRCVKKEDIVAARTIRRRLLKQFFRLYNRIGSLYKYPSGN